MVRSFIRGRAGYAAASIVIASLAGCAADGSDTSEMKQRQDAALADPFSYGPDMPTAKNAPPPKKRDDSLKGEWDRFWNP